MKKFPKGSVLTTSNVTSFELNTKEMLHEDLLYERKCRLIGAYDCVTNRLMSYVDRHHSYDECLFLYAVHDKMIDFNRETYNVLINSDQYSYDLIFDLCSLNSKIVATPFFCYHTKTNKVRVHFEREEDALMFKLRYEL